MKEYLSVQWHTGMLMLAQHFQQQGKYHEYHLRTLMQYVNKFLYGVIDMQYQYDNAGVLTINALNLIMPNLLPVQIEAQDIHEFLSIDLSKFTGQAGVKYKVFLVLQENSDCKDMFKPVNVGPIADDFDSENKEMIVKLQPNITLFFDKMPPLKHHSMILFEFMYVDEQWIMEEYCAPFLKWSDKNIILERVMKMMQTVRNKIYYLNLQKKISLDSISYDKTALINGLLCLEEQMYAQTHPYDVFKALVNLVSSIAAVSSDILPTIRYNHDNILQSYQLCIDYIYNVLDKIKEYYNRQSFITTEMGVKIAIKQLGIFSDREEKFLICSASMLVNYEKLDDWINTAIIATSSMINNALQQRVKGGVRQILEYVPVLNAKSDKDEMFFMIKIDNVFVKSDDEELIIYNYTKDYDSPDHVYGYSQLDVNL